MKKVLLILIIFLGLFLRCYRYQDYFFYGHDQDLIGWFIRDVVEKGHFRLIGQQTSMMGIFIGPFFYYYLIPFYLLFKMNPLAGVYGIWILSLMGIISFYYIFNRLYGYKAGIFASLVYSVSFFILLNDREVVPTMPVIIWTAWLYYAINLLLVGNKKGLLISGILVGLIWHLNMALALTVPLIFLAIFLSKKKMNFKYFLLGIIAAAILNLPLVVFELKHNFIQTKAFILAFSNDQGGVITGTYKYEKIFISQGNTVKNMILGPFLDINYKIIYFLGFFVFAYLIKKKTLNFNLSFLLFLWLLIYYLFFSLYSMRMSEYYINGSLMVWIILFILFVSEVTTKNKKTFLLLCFGFLAIHLTGYFRSGFDRKGYSEKIKLIEYIDNDRKLNNYSCISISYITDPGYELGWRYLYWYRNLKVLPPISNAPVYSIIYPLTKVDKVDVRFGSLGLILPRYSKYTREGVNKACSGEDSNLTDPMFGFTK